MILTPAEMKAAEEEAFSRGVKAEELMEIAGIGISEIVTQFHHRPGTCHVFYGKGHNGGDALVAARHLAQQGWAIVERPAFPAGSLSALTARQLEALRVIPDSVRPSKDSPTVVLDGLLGIGSEGAPRPPVSEAIRSVNALRQVHGAWVLAIDLPSGLEALAVGAESVRADVTATIAYAKAGLLTDDATDFVGRLALVPLPGIHAGGGDPARLALASWLARLQPPRPFDTHKGKSGRVGIVAGSPGFLGAAHLCSLGALHGGGGLITLFALPETAAALSIRCPPEIMVRTVTSLREIFHENLDVLAIGPGIGTSRKGEVLSLIRDLAIPVVADADALHAISENPILLKTCRGPRLLTPHPGEMERLNPQAGRCRRDWAEDFAREMNITLLLKGSRTVIASPSQPTTYNTTGHPGMATGGMGDVLTGVTAALIAQGHSPHHSAILGAWACGFAAESAIAAGASQESLSPLDVTNHLGRAFDALRRQLF
jgi:NAD(P)H-hydrate epimerase